MDVLCYVFVNLCFVYILQFNYLTFLFVPRNWSSTICTELERCCRLRGSGTWWRDRHRSNGVFGRRGFPKLCGIWRKDYGHGAALHVFAFWRCSAFCPQEIQLNLTECHCTSGSCQESKGLKFNSPGLNSRLKSNRQIPSLAACSSLSGWIKQCVNAVNGFVFFDGFWMVLSFQCFTGLEFFLAFPDLKLNSLQGLAHLSMMMATRWHAITLKCAWHVEALHSFWLLWNVGRKVDLTRAERRLKHSELCLKMLPSNVGTLGLDNLVIILLAEDSWQFDNFIAFHRYSTLEVPSQLLAENFA